MNKRGIALILSFMVIAVLTILGAAAFSRSISEKNINQRFIALDKAFWAAEAGLAEAASKLPDMDAAAAVSEDDFDGSGKLQYQILQISPTEYESDDPLYSECCSNNCCWEITARGSYNVSTSEPVPRTITAVVKKTGPNSNLITNAIETTGTLDIGNNVTISPNEEEYAEAGSSLTFEAVFGMTKDQVEALADHTQTNPETNWQPEGGMDNEIVWIEVTGNNKYLINSSWPSGSGLLIVDGRGLSDANQVSLDIAGGSFTGVIWIIGRLSISGPPNITGAVFAESGATIENKLTGQATLSFDDTVKDSAFDLPTEDAPVNFISWQEEE